MALFQKKPQVSIGSKPYELLILSKWGKMGEYIHKLDEVPDWMGTTYEFWSERKP